MPTFLAMDKLAKSNRTIPKRKNMRSISNAFLVISKNSEIRGLVTLSHLYHSLPGAGDANLSVLPTTARKLGLFVGNADRHGC